MRTELRRVSLDGGIGHLGHQPLVLRLDGVELIEHVCRLLISAGVTRVIPANRNFAVIPHPPDTGGRNATSSPSSSVAVIRA